MNFVEPIRDQKKIAQIKNQLRGQRRYRDLLLFVVGINTAFRISDLLSLRVEHFLDENQQIRQRFWIKEKKRGKRQEVVIKKSIRKTLNEYLGTYPEIIRDQTNFIFFSTKDNHFKKPIKQRQAWKTITTICHQVGLRGNFDTHSLRKTWGYHARMQGVDLALIMHKLNHESIAYTKRYLGITDEKISLTDPDAAPMRAQGSGSAVLGYRDHYILDGGKSRIILSAIVAPASIMDNTPLLDMLDWTCSRWKLEPKIAVGDAKYGTEPNIVGLENRGIQAYLPIPDLTKRNEYYSPDIFSI